MTFEWIPRQGIRPSALERMKAHFAKPTDPPYEAWFMAEINYYTSFLEEPPEALDWDYYWDDTGSGIRNFGRRREWVIWYQYLLPYVLPLLKDPNSGHNHLIKFIHYFINLYSKGRYLPSSPIVYEDQRWLANLDYAGGITEEYEGFREDILHSLGQAFMGSIFWPTDGLEPATLWYEDHGVESFWIDCYYASSFFCLMYLTPDEIKTWVASMVRHEDPRWQRELRVWLTGWQRFLRYYDHPSEIPANRVYMHYGEMTVKSYLAAAGIDWYDSDTVFEMLYSNRHLYDYIPAANFAALHEAVKQHPQLNLGNVAALSRTYVIDGSTFDTFDGFYSAIQQAMAPDITPVADSYHVHRVLTGGVGSRNYDDVILLWKNFDESKKHFGPESSADFFATGFEKNMQAKRIELQQEHPTWDERAIQQALAEHQRSRQWLLDEIVAVREGREESRLDYMVKVLRRYPSIRLQFEP